MPKLDSPLQLSPVFKPKIWGRNDLIPIFPRPQFPAVDADPRHDPSEALTARIAHGRSVDHRRPAQFLNRPLAGMTLGEAAEKFGPELNGKNWKDRRFPLLAKYIYTSDWLSVQVHPDDTQARTYDPGNRGKCEMWYIVHSDRKARNPARGEAGRTKERLCRRRSRRGTSRELLNRFGPRRARRSSFRPVPSTLWGRGWFSLRWRRTPTLRIDWMISAGLGWTASRARSTWIRAWSDAG